MTITRIHTLGGWPAVNIRELRAVYFARLDCIIPTITEVSR